MTFNTPQIIYLILVGMSVGICTARHGEKRTGEHNIIVDVIAVILQTALLYWGGFFG
jgi:hypothetical protein